MHYTPMAREIYTTIEICFTEGFESDCTEDSEINLFWKNNFGFPEHRNSTIALQMLCDNKKHEFIDKTNYNMNLLFASEVI